MVHKFDAVTIAKNLLNAGYQKYHDRIIQCADVLSFRATEDGLKLYQTFSYTPSGKKVPMIRFCRHRVCPLCQWRRSTMWKSRVLAAMPEITRDYPKHKFIFLTLTIKNPPLGQMRNALDLMRKAFKRMTAPYKVYKKKDCR